jgi:hypothetical protein
MAPLANGANGALGRSLVLCAFTGPDTAGAAANETDFKNAKNASCCAVTSASSPNSLKNHRRSGCCSHAPSKCTVFCAAFTPLSSMKENFPAGASMVCTVCASVASSMGGRPTWPRQRLTLGRSPPTSPGKAVTDMSALVPSAPLTRKLPLRMPLGSGCVVQSAGRVQVISEVPAVAGTGTAGDGASLGAR